MSVRTSPKQLKWHGANYTSMNLVGSFVLYPYEQFTSECMLWQMNPFVQIGIENSRKLLQNNVGKVHGEQKWQRHGSLSQRDCSTLQIN